MSAGGSELVRPGDRARRRVRFSVVICAYTEKRWLDIVAALESVAGQAVSALECLLVVDHNPALAARARDELDGCTVLESTEAPGLSGARNTGVEAARGDVVAFLDDDAVAAPDWLDRLAAAYEDPDVVAAGGLVSPAWVKERPGWFPVEFDWVVGCSHSGMPSAAGPVRNLVGANMSLRRSVLRELGGFSRHLGRVGADAAGCEETELCIRAAALWPGAVVHYDPAARVLHRVPPSRARWGYFLRRCLAEGRSKAAVASLAGRASGLASERAYVRSTLPRGVASALGEVLRGRLGALGRALAIVLGLAATVAGYSAGAGMVRRAGTVLAGLAAPAVAVGLWLSVLLGHVPLAAMTDLGLVSVLPTRFWIALVLLCVSFCAIVRKRGASPLVLAAHVLVLLVMLHGTPAVLYETLRYEWAWKHVSITDYVIAHHGVNLTLGDPTMVAYQDWPGFFTLNALVAGASGLASPINYAAWGPLFNELLYALPLMVIFGQLSDDARIKWSALWIFYLGNWIGQDYFSPQGFTFFLYLCVIAVVLRVFLLPPAGGRFGLAPRHRYLRRNGEPAMARLERLRPLAARAALGVGAPATRHPGRRRHGPGPLGWLGWPASSLAGAAAVGGSGPGGALLGGGAGRAGQIGRRGLASASIGLLGSPRALPGTAGVPVSATATGTARRREVVTGFAFCALCMWAIAASHQLTPFMLVFALVALALSRRLSHYSLALAAIVIAVAWIAIGARTFVSENLPIFYSGIGHFLSNATVAKYNAGLASPDQLLIADVDRIYTLAVGLLALIGAARAIRAGRWARLLPAALLAAAPAVALGSNNYGGEVVFRVFLFSLPFLAFFAASAFERRSAARAGVWLDAARGVVVLGLLAGFAVSYYGKERSNYFPTSEVRTIEAFYASIPPRSLVISAAGNFPWPLQHYDTYENYLFTTDHTSIVREIEADPAATLARDLGGPKPSYLVFAASDEALVHMTGALPPGEYQRIEHAVTASPLFRVLVHTGNVEIVTLAPR